MTLLAWFFTDDVQESDGQREESSGEREDRRHVETVQEPHGWQTGCEERAERCNGTWFS